MNFKKMFGALLSAAVIAGSVSVGSVSAKSYYSYSSGSYWVGTSGTKDIKIGGIYMGGQKVTTTYYNVNWGLWNSKVKTIDISCSNYLVHSAGVYSNGNSKWTKESQVAKHTTGSVSTNGYATIMASANQ